METLFGYTNDKDVYDAAKAWRTAAIKDGWKHGPIYEGKGQETERTACKLTKEGFVAQVYLRTMNLARYKYQADVSVWGPDGLAIPVPFTYNMRKLRAALRVCPHCKSKDVPTERYSFAGRACAKCLPALRQEHEKPGWCN